MTNPSHDWEQSVRETDRFYAEPGVFSYSDGQVDRWLAKWFFPYVELKGNERILDLCCGDGAWSFGLLRKFPCLTVTGVDISSEATGKAQMRAAALSLTGRTDYMSQDCEEKLPFPEASFDLVFARGVFVFNQHDMTRPGCIALLEQWHELLAARGRFVSMYGSRMEKLGTYTPPQETKGLPINLRPRKTDGVDFRGGKFNHSPQSFLSPFLSLRNSSIASYSFHSGRHTLITKKSLPSVAKEYQKAAADKKL
jgi:SAM-dependent methyltransferase